MTDQKLLELVDNRIQQFDGRLEQLVEQDISQTAISEMTIALVKLVETRAMLRRSIG